MHVPDGFLDAPTSVATGAVAVAGVALALRGARRELDDRTAPMAGLVATFVFAAQMINFPVGAGTSGHLLGGALAAVLVGPWSAVLCISVVLLVQALLMADGGITALGTNITLMGLVGVWVGWGVFVAGPPPAAAAYQLGRPGRRPRRLGERAGRRGRLLAALRGRRQGSGRPRHGPRRHGQLARRHRHRRGGGHRARRRQRRRHAAGPGPRRAPALETRELEIRRPVR